MAKKLTLKKLMRRVTKTRNRRRKMHPVRRRQETLGTLGIVASCVMFLIGGFVMVGLGVCVTLASCVSLLASKSSPPDATHTVKSTHRTKATAPKDKRIQHGTIHVGITGKIIGKNGKRKACGAACQYSTKPASTCDCSCGGRKHGMMAPTAGGKQGTKTKPKTRKRPAKPRS